MVFVRQRRFWLSFISVAALAACVGIWIGVKITERGVRRHEKMQAASLVEQNIELRAEVLGRWLEEMPVALSTIPLLSRAALEFKPDGTFTEEAELLTPERMPLQGMRWITTGTWRTRDGSHVVLEVRTASGPTTRPIGEYVFDAFTLGGELSLFTPRSPDRGEESRTYRRVLAKRVTQADVDGEKATFLETADDFRSDDE